MSFRSGAGASLIVGVITALSLMALSLTVFASLFVAGSALQVSVLDRVSGQLMNDVPIDEIELAGIDDAFLEDGFWAVREGETVLGSGGSFDQEVLDAPFSERDGFFDLESQISRSGTKRVDGRQWLMLERDLSLEDANYSVITAATGEFSLRQFIRDGLPFLIPVLLVVMAVAGLITSWFTRRALGSVEAMRLEVEQITQESLDRRVPTTGSGDRIDKLAETMNDMLSRLESSTEQQNQFLADASHELRSPVAGLLVQLEVASMYPESADTTELLPKLTSETQRLQLVLDDLLYLSRAAADDHVPPAPGRVDIQALLDAEISHQQALHPHLSFDLDGASTAFVPGNERDLLRAVRNLTDNAARHAVERVQLAVVDNESGVTITVADDGAGIPSEDAERIFDRFVRLDESRARDAGGSGLGLSIVQQIVFAHGGTVELGQGSESGATFVISLPRL